MGLSAHPLLYLIIQPALLSSEVTIFLSFQSEWNWIYFSSAIFRFLALAVRSSSLRSCGTPQPKTAASGSGFLKTTLWVYSRQGRA